MLEIELLGQFRVSVGGRALDGLPNPRLIAYLLLHRDTALSREQVAFALWPDSGDGQALTNLRRELHGLRRAIPDVDDVLAVEGRTVRWRADGPSRTDVAAFEAAVERGRDADGLALARAVELYRGDLLPMLYDDWVLAWRDQLRAQYGEALERLIGFHEERREYRAGADLVRRLIALDPLQESAYRLQMRLAMLLGDRSAALQAYHTCAAVLRRELDVEPGPEITAVYERLRTHDGPPAADDERSGGRPSRAPVHPLIGRHEEWGAMTRTWGESIETAPRLIVVRGEPGIGKTRLIEEFVRWCRGHGATTASTRSYEAEGALAYAPVAAWLRADPVLPTLIGLEPVWLTELARLVPEVLVDRPDLARPEPMTDGWQRQRLFEALVRAARVVPGPVLLVLDDAHWADRDTLEWLSYLLRSDPPTMVVVVAGVRPEEEQANPALVSLITDLRNRDQVHELSLARLGQNEASELAAAIANRPFDEKARRALFRETEGNPLFVIEVARAGLGDLGNRAETRADDGSTVLPLPPRMQAVIAARLERLDPDSRHLVEVAATIGRDFTVDILAEASDLDEDALVRALDDLWQRQIVREHGSGAYDFSHDRIRDVAANAIAPGRRRLLHRRVARAIELINAADLDQVSARMAAHYEAAAMRAQAIRFYERAADLAGRLSAHGDAARYLARAIALLQGEVQGAERDRRELTLQMARSAPLNATQGYPSPELEATLERGLALAEALDDRGQAILALNGLYHVHFVRGRIRRAVELAESALSLIGDDRAFLATGHLALAGPLTSLGELDRALASFETSIDCYDPDVSLPSIFNLDPLVFAMAWSSHALWLRGHRRAAGERAAQAVARAESRDHPFLRTLAHAYAAIEHQLAGSGTMVAHAHTAIALSERYGFPYYGEWGAIIEAWAARHRRSDSIERMEAALASLRSIGAESRRPYYLGLLADAHIAAGRPDRARAMLDAALSAGYANDDLWWLPEIHRGIGELDPGPAGEEALETAFALAVGQHSHSLALRAAASLARRNPDRAVELDARLAELSVGLDRDAMSGDEPWLGPDPVAAQP